MTEAIRVVIVDDHQVVRRGLQAYLALEPTIEVIGEGGDGDVAIALYTSLRPDVMLLDLQMEPVDGVQALREIRRLDPRARVIILTSFVDAGRVMPAMEAGASGYVLKTAEPAEIVRAVRAVMEGRGAFDHDAMQAMAQGMRQRSEIAELTEREMEVLRLLAEGMSNQEIAETLYIGLKTVKTHVSNVLAKLHVTDRTQAALYAVRVGIIQKP